jgi:hypothetical protein
MPNEKKYKFYVKKRFSVNYKQAEEVDYPS